MILKLDQLKEACSKILGAVDSNPLSILTETLEIKSENTNLLVSVTNKEYFVRVKIDMAEEVNFKATVKANLFLKLISQITTEDINLEVDDNNLHVRGNGHYKLPLIFEGDKLLELPEITINNPTSTFNIPTDILRSIITYNSKELSKGGISKPVQKMYYLDDKGCITFTSGACVNNFTLDEPVKILLNDRLVKLLKLFKSSKVKFTLGYDEISNDIIQPKVKFEDDIISITAVLPGDDNLISSVPVTAIRNRAANIYPYSITINKNAFLETISRLLLFADNSTIKLYSKFEFTKTFLKVWDVNESSNEVINYENNLEIINDKYEAILDLVDLKTTLETCLEEYVNLNFGDHQAVVIARNTIFNVIPECRVV